MLFMLLIMILLFFGLTSNPYALALPTSVGEVFKFTMVAVHKINVAGKSKVAYGPTTNGDRCVVVMECFLHELLWEQVEQDRCE